MNGDEQRLNPNAAAIPPPGGPATPQPTQPQTGLNVISRCFCERPWSARYPEGNVLHDALLPSVRLPENQERIALTRLHDLPFLFLL
jgi:hypothetical protein